MAWSVVACRTSGYSPPCSNWRNWTTNSTSRIPPLPGLDLDLGGPGRDGALLDPPLEGLDLGDLGGTEIAAIDKRLDRLEKRLAQREVAGDRAALDQRLPLPGAAAGHVVAQRGVQRARQRPLFAVGTQPHVDAIRDPQRGVVGQQADDVAPHPGKELGVGHDLGAGWSGRLRRRGRSDRCRSCS